MLTTKEKKWQIDTVKLRSSVLERNSLEIKFQDKEWDKIFNKKVDIQNI